VAPAAKEDAKKGQDGNAEQSGTTAPPAAPKKEKEGPCGLPRKCDVM
jgi:hypothetical protein